MTEDRVFRRHRRREIRRARSWYRYPDYWLVFIVGAGFGGFFFGGMVLLFAWLGA